MASNILKSVTCNKKIDRYYYSMSMKKYSLASVYLIIEAKREIRNQISFDEGGQKTLSLQFVGIANTSVGFPDLLPEVPSYNVYH